MQTNLSKFVSTLTLLASLAHAAPAVKLFTSEGVVYSYAVITSTIKPATTYVETIYYTTTEIEEITLANSKVTSSTKAVVKTSTFATTSTEAMADNNSQPTSAVEDTQPSSTSSFAATTSTGVSSTYTKQSVGSTENSDYSTSDAEPSSSSRSTKKTSTITSPTSSQEEISSTITSPTSSQEEISSTIASPTSSQEEISSTINTSRSTITPSPSSSEQRDAISSTGNLDEIAYTTTYNEDGFCEVYYADADEDDSDDDYYTTIYLTDENQSVDAYTTYTSTRIFYQTVSLIWCEWRII